MPEALPGPPKVRNNTGADVLTETIPSFEVSLDAGAFRAVWEAVEAGSKKWPGTAANEAFQRAQLAFREAYWGRQEHLEQIRQETPGKIVRTVVRKVAPPKSRTKERTR